MTDGESRLELVELRPVERVFDEEDVVACELWVSVFDVWAVFPEQLERESLVVLDL